jgi:hypothetical protein
MPGRFWTVQKSMRVINDAAKRQVGPQVTTLDRPDLSTLSVWFVRVFLRSPDLLGRHRELTPSLKTGRPIDRELFGPRRCGARSF